MPFSLLKITVLRKVARQSIPVSLIIDGLFLNPDPPRPVSFDTIPPDHAGLALICYLENDVPVGKTVLVPFNEGNPVNDLDALSTLQIF